MRLALALALTGLATGGETGVVVRPVANMYSSPAEDADVVSQAIYAAGVELLEVTGQWTKVRTADRYTGWMPLAALRKADKPYAAGGRAAQVESLFAHLYREASVTKHQPLLTVPFETRLEVVAEPEEGERRWLQVRLPDDRAAWVQRGDVAFDPPVLDVAQTVALAKRFLGLPYTWGGTSSFGYDCSGFAQMLCRRRGIVIPRDAAPQARWEGVRPVGRDDVQPGDLVYFGSDNRISHTGMCIGGGEFIHATTNGRPAVQISRLADLPWSRILVAVRRLK